MRTPLLIVLLAAALLNSCTKNVAGGDVTETGNARVAGIVVDAAGVVVENAIVRLIPVWFEPGSVTDPSIADPILAATDSNGSYNFDRPEMDFYNLEVFDPATESRFLARNIDLSHGADIARDKDTVRAPSSLAIGIPDSIRAQAQEFKLLGTTLFSSEITTEGTVNFVVFDSVPKGSLPSLVYRTADESFRPTLARALSVSLVDTQTVASVDEFPNATNTGVLGCFDSTLGRKLTYEDLTPLKRSRIDKAWVAEHGRILDKVDLDTNVNILADSITIRRSRIQGHILINWGYSGLTGIVIEDVEIDGTNSSYGIGIASKDFTARRCNIHSTIRGARTNSNTIVEDCYIHDLRAAEGGSTSDGVHTTGGSNIVIRGNAIENNRGANSCVFLGASGGAIENVIVENNLLNGGAFTIQVLPRETHPVTNVRIRNNRVGRMFFESGGQYRAVRIDTNVEYEFEGNVWDETDVPLEIE